MEKKKKTLLILGLCIFTLTLIGLSYAFWQITLKQTDENLVYTDCLKLDFTDENAISLQNAYPMTYEEQESFFASEIPYSFTITNECASKANLSINLETLPVEGENKLDDEWVDVILYEGNENYNMYETEVLNIPEYDEHYKVTANPKNDNKLLNNSIDAYNLYNFTIEKNEEKDFSMYLFLDEDTPLETEEGKKTTNAEWKGKVTINSVYRVPVKGMIRKIADESANDYEGDIDGIWQYKRQITKILFQNTLTPPENPVYSFDESDNGDESVMSYLVPNEGDDGTYTAYIQADGKIYGNYDSSYLFDNFVNVTSIEGLKYFDTSKVTNMDCMFSSMESLIELDLSQSNFDTKNVMSMWSMFYDMSSLTTLNLGEHFDTSQVTDMGYIFSSIGVTELNLPDSFDTRNVIYMDNMFSGIGVTELNLPESFDTRNVTDMSWMFYGMSALTELDLSQYDFDTSNVTDMSNMFEGMSALIDLKLGLNFNTSNVTNMDCMFSSMESLETLNLPESFDTSNVTDMSSMFVEMSALTTLNLGTQFDTSNVTDMNSMFEGISSLDTLDLSQCNFRTSNVTDMSNMFEGMRALTTLDLGTQFDTSNVTSMYSMFSNMSSLETLELGDQFNTNNVTDMSDMFSGMSALETLELGSNFDTSQVTDMHGMFSAMGSLTNLDLKDKFYTIQAIDMGQMFYNDSSLTSINYGDHFIRNPNAENTYAMFDGCPETLNKPTDESWA